MQRFGVSDLLPTHSSDVLIDKAGHELVRLKYIAGMFFKDLCGDLDHPLGLVQHRNAIQPCDSGIHQGWNQDGPQNQAVEPRSLRLGRFCWRPLPRLAPDSQMMTSPRYRMAIASYCHADLFLALI